MKNKNMVPDSKVCQRYGVVPYTLWRWDHDPELDFPKPVRIHNRKYRIEAELDEFDARRAAERDVINKATLVTKEATTQGERTEEAAA